MSVSTPVSIKLNRDEWVRTEAQRCLSCFDPPCQKACPAGIPIPEFIRSIISGNFYRASLLVREANPMAVICGAVCPQEVFCQSACTRGNIDEPIKIRNLHSFASGNEGKSEVTTTVQKGKVAIIGAGPAGLSAAIKLFRAGFQVTVFDKDSNAGGVPGASIPDFRLSVDQINRDLSYAASFGIEFKLGQEIDNPQSLLKEFDAVLIAAGLEIGNRLEIPGEHLPDVIDAISFLRKARLGIIKDVAGKRVVVVGGGNVSLDVASTAANLGASEVRLLYRRGPAEMKVWRSELKEAQKRGIIIEYLIAPVEIMGEGGNIEAVNCARIQLDDKCDSSGRRIPRQIRGSEFMMMTDLIITAVGLSSDYMRDIEIKSDLSTSIPRIFAAGDWARGEGTIVEAVRDGKAAAAAIISYLEAK
jgi:NADPH-dependent glutamate synthase beta subunit-like oxidoreductase